MAFLKLNNITVPVMECSATHGVIGASSRALRGDYLSDVRNIKRTWRVRCSPMTQQAASVLVGMLNGRGQLFTYDEDSYSESGFASSSEQGVTFDNGTTQIMGNTAADGAAVKNLYTAPSTAANVAARTSCVSSDSISTNILAAVERDCEGTPSTDFTAWNGAVLADDTTNYLQGSKSLNVTGAGGAYRGAYTTAACAVSTPSVCSFYVKGNDANSTQFRLWIEDDDGGDNSGVVYTLPSTGVWYRVWAPYTTESGAANINIEFHGYHATNAWDFSVDAWQIEQSSYVTAWVDGARASAGKIVYPASAMNYIGQQSWTVACWSNGSNVSDAGTDGVVWNVVKDTSNGLQDSAHLRFDGAPTPGTPYIVVYDSDGGAAHVITGAVHNYGPWKHYAVVYDAPTTTIYLFVNGVSAGSQNIGSLNLSGDAGAFSVGAYTGGTGPLNGQVDDLLIIPAALTATEALALYNSGTAPTIGYPRLIATGDFAHDTSVTVRGANVRQTNIHLNGVNNYKSVEFAMEEV
jgi:hypothetical protein